MAKIIEVDKLIKKYKKAKSNAVDNVSFDVTEGEFFSFLGPNGAGKTTTISILTTMLSKTSGQIKIAGFDLEKNQTKVRKNIGIIFQNPSLDQNLTAEENVRFHAILYGLYSFAPSYSLMPDKYKKKVQELATILGIEKEIHKPIKTFSGGMKRKLEIVRSLIHKPKILFLDEPTSGLDPLSRKNLWEYLDVVRKDEKTTIFLTTHYLEEAEGANSLCIINDGKIVFSGSPSKIKKDLIRQYLLVDSSYRNKLEKELTKAKLLKAEDTMQTPFKIDLTNKSAQKIISQIKTPLNYIQVHNPTLEDAYLEIIGQSEKKGNKENE